MHACVNPFNVVELFVVFPRFVSCLIFFILGSIRTQIHQVGRVRISFVPHTVFIREICSRGLTIGQAFGVLVPHGTESVIPFGWMFLSLGTCRESSSACFARNHVGVLDVVQFGLTFGTRRQVTFAEVGEGTIRTLSVVSSLMKDAEWRLTLFS